MDSCARRNRGRIEDTHHVCYEISKRNELFCILYPYSNGSGPNTPNLVSPRAHASRFDFATQHFSPSQKQPSQITQCTTTALHAVELTEHSQLRPHHLQREDTTDTVPFQNNKKFD